MGFDQFTAPQAPVVKTTAHPPRATRSPRKLWIITGLALIAVAAFYAIVFSIHWPFKKQALIDVLQERSHRSVTIARFRVTYLPPGCVAEGITFLRYKHKNQPPLITIQQLAISVTYPTLLTFQHRLDSVRVRGLHLIVPANEPPGNPSPMLLLTPSASESSLPIGRLDATGSLFEFYRGNDPQPLRVAFNRLSAQHVSTRTTIRYLAELSNSEVPGLIRLQGLLGPWDAKQTANTPVRGKFTYDHGDLSPIQAVSGTLFSRGAFNGTLGAIRITGSAQVQNFAVHGSSHARALAVNYKVTVNATNGSIGLETITAAFERSRVLLSGSISAAHPHDGEIASIQLSSNQARIEDLLELFISSKEPPMTGDVSFGAHFGLPPEYQSFIRDMKLSGNFGIAGSKFTNQSTEAGLTKLSQTSEAGKQEKSQHNVAMVLSDLRGQATVTGGIAHLSHVEFHIPGADARLSGTYSLRTFQADFAGTLMTSGNVSDTQTGAKSLFLKALTPFLKHHDKVKIIPFKITGPYGHTTTSLDLGHNSHRIYY